MAEFDYIFLSFNCKHSIYHFMQLLLPFFLLLLILLTAHTITVSDTSPLLTYFSHLHYSYRHVYHFLLCNRDDNLTQHDFFPIIYLPVSQTYTLLIHFITQYIFGLILLHWLGSNSRDMVSFFTHYLVSSIDGLIP